MIMFAWPLAGASAVASGARWQNYLPLHLSKLDTWPRWWPRALAHIVTISLTGAGRRAAWRLMHELVLKSQLLAVVGGRLPP